MIEHLLSEHIVRPAVNSATSLDLNAVIKSNRLNRDARISISYRLNVEYVIAEG